MKTIEELKNWVINARKQGALYFDIVGLINEFYCRDMCDNDTRITLQKWAYLNFCV